MSGYYDYTPTVELDRTVALVSLDTEEARRAALHLAALTGLPYRDLDRQIEHRAGMSLRELVVRHGEERYRSLERQELAVALRDTPPGLVVFGDGTLMDERNRTLALAQARVIALGLDLAGLYWRLRSRLGSEQPWHPLHGAPLATIEELRPFVEARRAGLGAVHHVVVWQGRSQSVAFSELQALVATAPS